jgi:16S rRNA U516 pseudouridylate synthase RsuA-like enzyme
VGIGAFALSGLPAGEWRRLGPEEIASLQAPRGTITRRPRTGRV